MTTAKETATVVKLVRHSAIRMQFDTGAFTISGEDPHKFLRENSDIVGHIHISEPDLVPLGQGETNHTKMADAIRQYLPEKTVAIEMLTNELFQIDNAMTLTVKLYGDKLGQDI